MTYPTDGYTAKAVTLSANAGYQDDSDHNITIHIDLTEGSNAANVNDQLLDDLLAVMEAKLATDYPSPYVVLGAKHWTGTRTN